MYAVAPARRDAVMPSQVADIVLHFSIPALEQTGSPALEAAADIASAKSRVFGGEVLVSRLNPRKGRVVVVPPHMEAPAVASSEFVVLVPKRDRVDARFLAYLIGEESFRQSLDAQVRSVTRSHQRVEPEAISQARVSLPELDEQRRIADFLDDQVTRIDNIIAARREQTERLGEHLEAFVASAVVGRQVQGDRRPMTAGWLDSVPATWPVQTVQSEFDVQLGKMLDERKVVGDSLLPYLRNTNVQWDHIDLTDLKQMDFAAHERPRFLLRRGDLLICEGGQPGRAAIWDARVAAIGYQKALHRARSRGRSSPRWLFYCLRAAVAAQVFTAGAEQATIVHLTGEQLRSLRFPFPPRAEQEAIIALLDAESALLGEQRRTLDTSIALLQERKRSLITAAVTGELDVTTARAGLPA